MLQLGFQDTTHLAKGDPDTYQQAKMQRPVKRTMGTG